MRTGIIAVVALLSCGDPKAPSSAPLADTRLELTLDDGTKPPPLSGRAFAVLSTNDELHIFVFDEKAAEPTCTDVNVGGWMEKAGAGGAVQIRLARFSGRPGKHSIAGIAHVHGGASKAKVALRSASAKGASIDVTRYDQVFEATIAGTKISGTVSGIVCAAK